MVFGKANPPEIYHLSLKSGASSLSISESEKRTYKFPQIWWYIWENGCETCKEAEIDANDAKNKLIKAINRF